jgi:multisubunit Na+/H+ antiporter MnhG subunit
MKLGGASDGKEKKLEKRIEKAKRPHSTYQDALVLGVALCVLAGVLFALSAAVSWADIRMPGFPVDQRYIMDLDTSSENFAYLWTIPFGGIGIAITAIAQLSRPFVEGGWRRAMGVATLVLAMVVSVISIIAIFRLQDVVINPSGNGSSYGPGVFISVFGVVLAVSGSLILFADVMRDEERSDLPERWAKSRDSTEEKEYVMPPERPKGKGKKCPKCGAQVKSDWDECPICGAELD